MINVNLAAVIPLMSSILIITTQNLCIALIGYYGYYVGIAVLMMYLINFTKVYCQGTSKLAKNHVLTLTYVLCVIDILQLIFTSVYGYAFKVKEIVVDGRVGFTSIPCTGLHVHRFICYVIFATLLVVFLISAVNTSKLYKEKFVVIIVSMIATCVIQTAYIIKPSVVDRSIIAHSLLCIVLFYFSIVYRPFRLLDTMLSNVAEEMDGYVYMFDTTDECIWANEQGYNLLKIPVGKASKIASALSMRFNGILNQDELGINDIYLPATDEYFSAEKKSIRSSTRRIDGYFIIIHNLTERRRKIEKDVYDSMHDSLTGLYNKTYLQNSIGKLLTSPKSTGNFYVVYLNIKNFKAINDIFGMDYGDKVLIAIADWMKENLDSAQCTYARLVGDTFAIVMPKSIFKRKLFEDSFSKFIVTHDDVSHQIFVHIGVYEISDRSIDVSSIFDRVKFAVSSITDDYKSFIKFYDEEIRQYALEEQQLTAGLEDAINAEQIKPYLQPIVNTTGKVVGAEALARWIHPEKGFMSPSKFIPMFENNGMIVKIDRYMWECACKILRDWQKQGKELFISVNISPKDFYFIDVVKEICRLVDKYKIDPIKLRLEITESSVFADNDKKIKILNRFRSKGFIVEMDDFGSGYSSLNTLKDMPVDILKIDMKFLTNSSKRAQIIVKNIINMSNELEIIALTEGVENQQQYDKLTEMGCKLFQGYYFAKPMSVEDFEDYLELK